MKILIIGSGGREHALCWKIAQSPLVSKIYCAPGNGGTYIENKCENVNLKDIKELIKFAKKEKIDITIVGPEKPLVEGIVDEFNKEGLKIFGPSKKASLLEGSKIYAKEFMKKYGIKTAESKKFDDYTKALKYIKEKEYPLVIKADGLASGKGVIICENAKQGEKALKDFMMNDIFKGAGKKIIVEEYLEGIEASILSITDGKTIIPFISCKDHKQIFDGNKGPNTGGMGAIAPNPYCSKDVIDDFKKYIMSPTLKGIKEEKLNYKGIIFFGLMITKKGVYLLEYNVRMGDPETQSVLYIMESDLISIINEALNKNLKNVSIKWREGYACNIIAASKGYPNNYEKGYEIKFLNDLDEYRSYCEGKVFISGADFKDGVLKTSGGRVLSVVSIGKTLDDARKNSYNLLNNIKFENMYYREDIGCVAEQNLL